VSHTVYAFTPDKSKACGERGVVPGTLPGEKEEEEEELVLSS